MQVVRYLQRFARRLFPSIFMGCAFSCGGHTCQPAEPCSAVVIGPSGGIVVAHGGAVTLTFPPGAVTQDVAVSVEAAQAFPHDARVVNGTVFRFGPEGTQFSKPVQLVVKYGLDLVPLGATSLALYKVVGPAWQEVGGSVADAAGKTISAPIASFSTYGVRAVSIAATCTLSGSSLSWPVCPDDRTKLGQTYAEFNARGNVKYHSGVDIVSPEGTSVFAAGAGTVRRLDMQQGVFNGDNHCMGNVVIIDHSSGSNPAGPFSLYGHLQEIDIENGTLVAQGAMIGKVGSTGAGRIPNCPASITPHLHFEVKDHGVLGSMTDEGPYWGYTGDGQHLFGDDQHPFVTGVPYYHPDNYGYHDPILYLHDVSTRSSQIPVRMIVVGQETSLRVGPGDYRIVGTIGTGATLHAVRTSQTTSAPPCSGGWYEVERTDLIHFPYYFPDPQLGPGIIPEAWVCKGDGQDWFADVKSHYFGISCSDSYGGFGFVMIDYPRSGEEYPVPLRSTNGDVFCSHGSLAWDPTNQRLIDLGVGGKADYTGTSQLIAIDRFGDAPYSVLCTGSQPVLNLYTLAIDANGVVYGTNGTAFYRVNLSDCSEQLLGTSPTPVALQNITFDPDGRLYVSFYPVNGSVSLGIVDQVTWGVTTVCQNLAIPHANQPSPNIKGMAWDPASRVLVMTELYSYSLLTIDPTTCQVSVIWQAPNTDPYIPVGLAFVP